MLFYAKKVPLIQNQADPYHGSLSNIPLRTAELGRPFYKNLFFENVEAEMNQNFYNVLRTFLTLRVD